MPKTFADLDKALDLMRKAKKSARTATDNEKETFMTKIERIASMAEAIINNPDENNSNMDGGRRTKSRKVHHRKGRGKTHRA
jgi:hypothetical protein